MKFTVTILVITLTSAALGQESQTSQSHETVSLPETGGERDGASKPNLQNVERLIVEETNAFRQEHGREPVAVDQSLETAAREFAEYMAKNGQYGHRADGRTPHERTAAAGYENCVVRENIAYAFRSSGFTTEQLAERHVTGWKESPGHRRNMLARHVTETGVAVAKSEGSDIYLAVQIFARPQSAAIQFVATNESDLTVTYRVGHRSFPLAPRVTRTHQMCTPQAVVFLPANSEDEAADPASPVARMKPEDEDRLVVVPADVGYRVETRREETARKTGG